MWKDILGTILLGLGFFLVIGTVGAADYSIAARTAFDDFRLLRDVGIGVLMMGAGANLKGWTK